MTRGELLEKLEAGESLREVDLTEADPLYADFEGVDLTGADLSRTQVPAGVTGNTWPYGLADSYRAPRWRARFSGATLDGAKLNRIVGWKGDFRSARLRDASMVEADLTDADFRDADLRGADLTGARIEGADFTGAIWDETTTWPEEAPPGDRRPARLRDSGPALPGHRGE